MPSFAWMRIVCLSLLCLNLGACVSYKSNTEANSTPIPGTLWMAHMVPGETPSGWLIEQFGYPDKVTHASATSSVWQYENVQQRSKEIRALPLFAVELIDVERTLYNFEIVDDRVARYWRQNSD